MKVNQSNGILQLTKTCLLRPAQSVEMFDFHQGKFIFWKVGCDTGIASIIQLEANDAEADFKIVAFLQKIKVGTGWKNGIDFRSAFGFPGMSPGKNGFYVFIKFMVGQIIIREDTIAGDVFHTDDKFLPFLNQVGKHIEALIPRSAIKMAGAEA